MSMDWSGEMVLTTQSSVVNEHEDNGKCRYWPAASFCDRAMSEIVCQLWPQLVSHLAFKRRKGRREVGKVNFSKFVYLPVKRRVVARLDKRGTSVVGAGLDILVLMA